jgi:hypothetical protein
MSSQNILGKLQNIEILALPTLSQHRAAVTRDLFFFLCGDDLNFVSGNAKKLKAVRGCGPNVDAVLSDPSGEDKQVHTPK